MPRRRPGVVILADRPAPSVRPGASSGGYVRVDDGDGYRLEGAVTGHLFIVSRQEPQLFAYLSREFASEDDVQVILDRRVGDRRKSTVTHPVERRQADRRTLAHVPRQISSLGYAFVRVDG